MSKKQLRNLILIIVCAVLIVGLVIAALFLFDGSGGEVDTEQIKIAGGLETFKSDLVSATKMKDSQAATIANLFFDEIGIEKYENMTTGGLKGNYSIYCDGFKFDTRIVAGKIQNAYIGNVMVYRNLDGGAAPTQNALEYSYSQYKILVDSFTRGIKVDANVGKDLYETLTLKGINSFNEIKSGKENGLAGFYGYEGMLKYFMTLNGNEISKIYVICDGFDPIEVYNGTTGKSEYDLTSVKVLYGKRQGIANVLAYKIKQATELEVILPAALLTGDDSWLMVQKDGEVYVEVSGEVKEKDKTKVQDFVLKLDSDSNDIKYLKIGRKVYVE